MASSSTGRWVRRVGAAGGGRTYRRRRPVNYYGVLVVICVLGVASVALARYNYQHPAGAAPQQPPTTSNTWYAALGVNTCGDQQPALAPNPLSASSGVIALQNGVLQIHPVSATQTGANATLQLFVSGYHGLALEPRALVLPPTKKGGKPTTWVSGQKCPKGTKDAGKKGVVEITYWRNLSAAHSHSTQVAGLVRFTPNMLVTIGFVPLSKSLPKPPDSAVRAMLSASTAPTTTTTLGIPTTTGHGATTTIPYGTTTTIPYGTTTTTKH